MRITPCNIFCLFSIYSILYNVDVYMLSNVFTVHYCLEYIYIVYSIYTLYIYTYLWCHILFCSYNNYTSSTLTSCTSPKQHTLTYLQLKTFVSDNYNWGQRLTTYPLCMWACFATTADLCSFILVYGYPCFCLSNIYMYSCIEDSFTWNWHYIAVISSVDVRLSWKGQLCRTPGHF